MFIGLLGPARQAELILQPNDIVSASPETVVDDTCPASAMHVTKMCYSRMPQSTYLRVVSSAYRTAYTLEIILEMGVTVSGNRSAELS